VFPSLHVSKQHNRTQVSGPWSIKSVVWSQALGFSYDCEGSCEGECHRCAAL
jgi:hypothetical protein